MQHLNTKKFLLFIIVILSVVLVAALLRKDTGSLAFSQQEKTSEEKNNKENMPLAIFSDSQPADARELALRNARSARYNGRLSKPLNEITGNGLMRTTHWWINLPGLPTAQSDAVILGEVVEASAYLSSDKSNVYSEFNLRIEEVFKDESGRSLVKARNLIMSREGGRVQLPDGRVLYVMSSDQGMPARNRRYLFFLKQNNEGKDYGIITGYRLYQGKVTLLDEVDLERFATYKGMTEESFLNAVREAVSNPPQAPRDIER